MAELADALDLGSSVSRREGSSPLPAPKHENPNLIRQVVPVGDGFGFLLYL